MDQSEETGKDVPNWKIEKPHENQSQILSKTTFAAWHLRYYTKLNQELNASNFDWEAMHREMKEKRISITNKKSINSNKCNMGI